MIMAVTLRPFTEADLPFLRAVYASTRTDEMRLTGWDAAQIDAFLTMQFTAQHRYYTENYTHARFDVIEQDGVGVGRLYVADWETTIRIIDIALLPDFRGRGIGTRLITDLFARADQRGVTVSIHVEPNNPARRLYERLGFQLVEIVNAFYLLMERPPQPKPEAAP